MIFDGRFKWFPIRMNRGRLGRQYMNLPCRRLVSKTGNVLQMRSTLSQNACAVVHYLERLQALGSVYDVQAKSLMLVPSEHLRPPRDWQLHQVSQETS